MNKHVVVVGGGFAGITMCIALHQQGYSVSLLEQEHSLLSPDKNGTMISIRPNGLQSLEKINKSIVQDIFACNEGHIVEEVVRLVDSQGRSVFPSQKKHFPTLFGYPKKYMRRQKLIEILIQHLPSSVHVYTSINLNQIKQEATGVRVCFHTHGIYMELSAYILIAADGVHSTVRKMIGFKPFKKIKYITCRGLVSIADVPKTMINDCYQEHNSGVRLFRTGLLDGVHIGYSLTFKTKDSIQKVYSLSPSEKKQMVINACRGMNSISLFFVKQTIENSLYFGNLYFLKLQKKYVYKNNIVFVGDALCPLVPTLGMGANTCFEDICVFIQCLQKYPENLTKALQIYANHRTKRRRKLGFYSYAILLFYSIGNQPWIQNIKDKIAKYFFQTRLSKSHALDWLFKPNLTID